jgi:hypothetical protein
MGTPLDLNSFLQNFHQQKDSLQDLLNKFTTNLSNNINTVTNQPQVPNVPTQQPPPYAYFLNPNPNPIQNSIPNPPSINLQSQLSSTIQLLEKSINNTQPTIPSYNAYNPIDIFSSNHMHSAPPLPQYQIDQVLTQQIESLKNSIAAQTNQQTNDNR